LGKGKEGNNHYQQERSKREENILYLLTRESRGAKKTDYGKDGELVQRKKNSEHSQPRLEDQGEKKVDHALKEGKRKSLSNMKLQT